MNALMARHNSRGTSYRRSRWCVNEMQRIRDTYYDSGDVLAEKGIWIRFRSSSSIAPDGISSDAPPLGKWDAKIRLGGDFIESVFAEVQGEEKMRDLLSEHLPDVRLEDLEVKADLETMRTSWTLSETTEVNNDAATITGHGQSLSVVVDLVAAVDDINKEDGMHFTHEVGEIELTKSLATPLEGENHNENERLEMECMRAHLKRFMVQNSELFSEMEPKGKLSAYFDWSKR